jgi:hypothetical protein
MGWCLVKHGDNFAFYLGIGYLALWVSMLDQRDLWKVCRNMSVYNSKWVYTAAWEEKKCFQFISDIRFFTARNKKS